MAPKARSGGREGSGFTRLLVPLHLARPELEKLVAEGRELRSRADAGEFGTLSSPAPWRSWTLDTQRLLVNWFSNEDVASAFGIVQTSGSEPTVRDWLDFQVPFLEGLLRRLDGYAIPLPSSRTGDASSGSPERKQAPGPSYITYNIRGSVGQLIAGEGQTVKNIDSHIAAVVEHGETQLAAALQRLAEVALNDPALDQQTRAEVLETIEDLGEAAEAQPEERKTGRVKGAIAVIGAAAGTAKQLGEAWQQWGPMITEHLRLP